MRQAFYLDNSQCCGCGTCAIVCPTGAIKMVPLELGALYPQVDAEKCVNCQKCICACAYQSPLEYVAKPITAYAAAAQDKDVLIKSASGGVFATLAKAFLNEGGAAFGCSLEFVNGVLTPMHICVETQKDLYKLQGSKYVQSELGDTFVQIKRLLKEKRKILFSGTPCQVDALKKYVLNVDASNLYTIDLICHGVPSAKLFQDYLQQLSKKQIVDFRFRDKTFGWGLNAKYSYLDKRGMKRERLLSPDISSYYSFFLSSEIYRQSCYSCKYANMNRVGDITIGDFWGLENVHPACLAENGGAFNVSEGVSAILVNTAKGEKLLSQCGKQLVTYKTQPQSIAKENRQLNGASKYSDVRGQISRQYVLQGYIGIESMFRKQLGIRYWYRRIKNIVRKKTP